VGTVETDRPPAFGMVATTTEGRTDSRPGRGPSSGRRRVMVIEDDPIVRLGLQAVLEDRGDAVILAVSATEALARLAAGAAAPDVIVADYRLRDGLFGTDAIRRVRDAVGRAVPAVLLTGEALSDLRAEADLQGLVVAGKPIGSQELGRVIDIAMGS